MPLLRSAVLPPDGPPAVLHPCLHGGYNATYRRVASRLPHGSPADVLLLGR